MVRLLLISALITVTAAFASALETREGWVIHDTGKSFDELVGAVRAAVKKAPIAVVTQASASDGARSQGHEIPGNRVFGLYRNDYARRMLAASVASGIEAPIRLYVTENADGTASLSYKTPTAVFLPYFDEGGDALRDLATELDGIFDSVAEMAIND